VIELREPYLLNGHTVFIDNWFTSPSLFINLEKKKNKCSWDSKSLPQKHARAVQVNKKGETKVVYSHKMMLLQWMDRKPVTILSTCYDDVEMTNTSKINRKTNMPDIKPKVVTDYNSMNAVDKQDQLSSFPVMRKYSKGYKKKSFYMM
jgi:hypothetical protein